MAENAKDKQPSVEKVASLPEKLPTPEPVGNTSREGAGATQRKAAGGRRVNKKVFWILLIVLLPLILAAIIVCYILFSGHSSKTIAENCSRKCSRSDLLKPHPPLLVISMDGYAHYYLARNLQPTFDRIAKCGVTAERVFSSFPTLTFPNHYTMATGDFPGHHGIVSNAIYDTTISDEPLHLSKFFIDAFYLKEPIWSVYKRFSKRKAATFSWVGSYHNSTRFLQPDYRVYYSKSLTKQERLDAIMKWLRMDEENRPGLIMAYFDEPDATGHNTVDEGLSKMLKTLDELLGRLLDDLDREGFLPCMNLAIVSDHGMSRITSHVLLEDFLNITGLFVTYGAEAQIFRLHSNLTHDDVLGRLSCQTGDYARVFTKETMPIRFHYTKSRRISDVVAVGVNGGLINAGPTTVRFDKDGAHGYDFIEPSVHTIMFARGPSFKENYVLPSFQNVEYMNLWTKLLGIPMVRTDGDPWFMDLALKNHTTPEPIYQDIPECLKWSSSNVRLCVNCSSDELALAKRWADCKRSTVSQTVVAQHFPMSIGDFCVITGCEDMVIISTAPGNVHSATLIEKYGAMKKSDFENTTLSGKCIFQLADVNAKCPKITVAAGHELYSISAYPEAVMARERHVVIPLKSGFITEFLEPLNAYTRQIASNRTLLSITGWVYNYDYGGEYLKLQPKTANIPTHIFRILISCKNNNWSAKGSHCANSKDTEALSFILPHVDSDPNCMDKRRLLLQYTATVKEVEVISGQYFKLVNMPFMEQHVMKLHVNTELW